MPTIQILEQDTYSGTITTSEFDIPQTVGDSFSALVVMGDDDALNPPTSLKVTLEVSPDGVTFREDSSTTWVGGPGRPGNPPPRPGILYTTTAVNTPTKGRLTIDTNGGSMLFGAEVNLP